MKEFLYGTSMAITIFFLVPAFFYLFFASLEWLQYAWENGWLLPDSGRSLGF